MVRFDFDAMRFSNPCMQQDTSMSSVFQNGLDIPSGSPSFSDSELIHIYRDFDMLNQDYDPVSISLSKEIEGLTAKMSQVNADSNSENV